MQQKATYCYKYPRPAVTTDIVVFTIDADKFKVLLIRRKRSPNRNDWALPGGFLGIDESIEDCARRELREETGLTATYLEQLYTFGDLQRDPRERIISIAYFALLSSDNHQTSAGSDASDGRWFGIDALPRLAFDHDIIIAKAHERLTAKLGYSNIGFQLLPKTFTLSEVQTVYEILLNRCIDKRNFRKKIMALDLICETGELRCTGKHRPAKVYRLKERNKVEII